MTLHAPIAGAPQHIDEALTIFHSDSGTVEGPRIKGRILAPTADWLRAMPGGSLRVDARMSIATDDGAQIYAQYGGVIAIAPADFARMAAGDTLARSGDVFRHRADLPDRRPRAMPGSTRCRRSARRWRSRAARAAMCATKCSQ